MSRRTYHLSVNGERRRVSAEPDEPLLWVLRDDLRLTGTKFGCGLGQCGACKVLIDGRPLWSCQVPVESVADGKEIVTIEGLGQPGNLSTLQAAFARRTAFGCGYCTPGMIIAATALLLDNPKPTRAEIVAAMNGHLCRCAAYPNIIAAIQSAASADEPEDGS